MTASERRSTRALVLLFCLSTLDGLLTLWELAEGWASEANPLLAGLHNHHPMLFYVVKQAMVFTSCALLLKVWRFRPATVTVATVVGVALYLGVLGYHGYMLTQVFAL